MKKTNTILLIITILLLSFGIVYSSRQRTEIAKENIQSNKMLKKSNDSLISVIKDFIK